jgi:ABC-type branched-subunit amino acid transport system permease subunit
VHGWGEPLSGLAVAGAVGALAGFATGFLVVRGSDLARLMVTMGIALMLYEAANQLPSITGGADGLSGVAMGKLFGLFAFDLAGTTAYGLQPVRALRALRRRAKDRGLALWTVAACRAGERRAECPPSARR